MTTRLGYRINSELKREYDNLINDKYSHKRNRCGSELSKWMKLGLVINGRSNYIDDPDVQELLAAAKKFSCTHTHTSDDHDDTNKNSNNDIEDRFQEMENKIKELEEQLAEREPTREQFKIAKEQRKYRDHSMDRLISSFYEEYGHDEQISINDISQLIMKTHGVVDKRSIENRVQYLMASGCIESFAPNVYKIK